jgi:hypothetical protein
MSNPNFRIDQEKQLDDPIIVSTTPSNVSPSIAYNIGYMITNIDTTIITLTESLMKTGGGAAVLSFTIPNVYCLPSGDPRGGTMVYVSGGLYIPGSFALIQSSDPVRIEFYDSAGATLADNDIVTRQQLTIYAS